MLFFQGKKDKRNQEADCIQSMLIRKEVKSIFFAVVGTTFIFALLMMTGAYALTVHPLNPQNPLTMFASTPDGFTNNDPHTIQTIFATVRKADLGQYGFQWQASGQVKNTSDKALKDLNVNIQLIDSTGKIVGLVPTITNAALLDLQPGQTTTFDGLLNGDVVSANAVAFKLTFEWEGSSAPVSSSLPPPPSTAISTVSNTQQQQNSNTINPTALDAIKSKYQQFAHTLGKPTTDIQGTRGGAAYPQKFENGWIFWSPTGAHEVHVAIAEKWDKFGRDHGMLGFPISDEHSAAGGRQNDFEHGSLLDCR